MNRELGIAGTVFSPGLRRMMGRVGSKEAFQEGAADLRELTGVELGATPEIHVLHEWTVHPSIGIVRTRVPANYLSEESHFCPVGLKQGLPQERSAAGMLFAFLVLDTLRRLGQVAGIDS